MTLLKKTLIPLLKKTLKIIIQVLIIQVIIKKKLTKRKLKKYLIIGTVKR
jgi:hypothetical protein